MELPALLSFGLFKFRTTTSVHYLKILNTNLGLSFFSAAAELLNLKWNWPKNC